MQTTYDYFALTGDFLLKQIKNLSSGTTPSVISQFDYTYRPDRSIDTWKQDQGSGAKTWSYGYDDAHQLIKAESRDASNALVDSFYYGYDKAGNRVQVGNPSTAPDNYETNNLNQLLSKRDFGPTTFAGFTDEPSTVKVNGSPAKMTSTDGGAPYRFESTVNFDAGANTVTVEAKDGQNNTSSKTYAVTTTGTSEKYEYDLNGNLRYIKQPNGTVIREYQWDQQNRLVKALIGTHESDYEYDGASRRWRITEKESGTQTKQETFVWCGGRICQKRNSSGVERSYFGRGFQEGSSSYFYGRDHLGSIREVVGADGMTIGTRLSYDPWGKSTETGSGAKGDFTYTGHYFDRATGLNLALYRGYDAQSGRWLSRDPLGVAAGPNVYGYVRNNPMNGIDPFGLDTLDDLSEFESLGGLDYLASFGVGVLNNIPLYGAAGISPTLGTLAKLAGLGGHHRCVASGDDPADKGETAGTIAGAVILAAGGSLRRAPAAINSAGITQKEAIDVIKAIGAAKGGNFAVIPVALADGGIALVGNAIGSGVDIIHVAADGTTTFASATVNALIGPNGPVHIVTDIVPK
jgi:RHS repeat-associated protein